jgi:hypothetical protein
MNRYPFHGCSLLACAALVVTCLVPLAGPASAAGEGRRHLENGAESAVNPASVPRSSGKAPPTHVVDEGGTPRPLWLDSGRVAEFDKTGSGKPIIRPAAAGDASPSGKSDPASAAAGGRQVSPLFVDAGGQPRALAGGVIVTLRQDLPEAQARDLLQDAGLAPLRQIGARMWLVDSPVGLASLDLADRLHGDSRFEFVQPNWWRPRTTK